MATTLSQLLIDQVLPSRGLLQYLAISENWPILGAVEIHFWSLYGEQYYSQNPPGLKLEGAVMAQLAWPTTLDKAG